MNRKDLKTAYKQTPRPMGVYQIRNQHNGKRYVLSSMNIPGSFNSQRFQLKMHGHRNPMLQRDWDEMGADSFTFEVLETLKAEAIPQNEWRNAISDMEIKWLNKLQPFGENGYNKEPAKK